MTQKIPPISKVFSSGWTPPDIYPETGELNPEDSTFVAAEATGTATFTVGLGPACNPPKGPQTLKVRLARTAESPTDPVPVTVTLLKGTQAIGSRVLDVAGDTPFTTYDLQLTAAEIDAIGGNYSNLRVRVSLAEGVEACWCDNVPTTLLGSITSATCPEANGKTVELTLRIVPGDQYWEGVVVVGKKRWGIMIRCSQVEGRWYIGAPYGGEGYDCHPNPGHNTSGTFRCPETGLLVFADYLMSGTECCGGEVPRITLVV